MNEPIDLLQIKIERAKAQLPEDTQNAINAVDWEAVILGIRETKGYSLEQLGDLEIETELVLCGLLTPENYPKELEKRMRLSRAEVDDLVKEMNERVFAKIKENLIKNIEREKVFTEKQIPEEMPDTEKEEKNNTQIFNSAGIEIISTPPPILVQKLSNFVKNEVKETNHSLNNLTHSSTPSISPNKPTIDPYREIPE